jgi:hypothetical protein
MKDLRRSAALICDIFGRMSFSLNAMNSAASRSAQVAEPPFASRLTIAMFALTGEERIRSIV